MGCLGFAHRLDRPLWRACISTPSESTGQVLNPCWLTWIIRRYGTVGHFARSLEGLHEFANTTLSVAAGPAQLPTVLLYPVDFFPLPDPDHQNLLEEFVQVLERHLGTKRVDISLEKIWEDTPPAAAGDQRLQQYMAKVELADNVLSNNTD